MTSGIEAKGRYAINELHKLLPADIANTEQAKRLYEYGCVTEMDIVQLIYRWIEAQQQMPALPEGITHLSCCGWFYRGEAKASPQQDAAIECLPYENPKLSAMAISVNERT